MPGAGLSAEQVAREGLVNEGWVVSGGGRRGGVISWIQSRLWKQFSLPVSYDTFGPENHEKFVLSVNFIL